MVKLAAVLSLPLLLVGVMGSSSCLIVDVKEGGPDGMHIVVPVPLFLAQMALSFVPEEHTRFPVEEAAEYIPMAERFIARAREHSRHGARTGRGKRRARRHFEGRRSVWRSKSSKETGSKSWSTCPSQQFRRFWPASMARPSKLLRP